MNSSHCAINKQKHKQAGYIRSNTVCQTATSKKGMNKSNTATSMLNEPTLFVNTLKADTFRQTTIQTPLKKKRLKLLRQIREELKARPTAAISRPLGRLQGSVGRFWLPLVKGNSCDGGGGSGLAVQHAVVVHPSAVQLHRLRPQAPPATQEHDISAPPRPVPALMSARK